MRMRLNGGKFCRQRPFPSALTTRQKPLHFGVHLLIHTPHENGASAISVSIQRRYRRRLSTKDPSSHRKEEARPRWKGPVKSHPLPSPCVHASRAARILDAIQKGAFGARNQHYTCDRVHWRQVSFKHSHQHLPMFNFMQMGRQRSCHQSCTISRPDANAS